MTTDEFPLSKGWIQAMCVLLTPLSGSFLYYGLRKNYPAAASYANKWSFISWALWIGLALSQHFLLR
jgi:hypothetical protein